MPEPWLWSASTTSGLDVITNPDDIVRQIAILKDRLTTLDRGRSEITIRLLAFERAQAAEVKMPPPDAARVTTASSTAATGRYLGEGFDDARLDTLFLIMPISWPGILAQYAGRLHRLYATKREVVIYDYIDGNEPMLAKMAAKREAGYRNLGYRAASIKELDLVSLANERRR